MPKRSSGDIVKYGCKICGKDVKVKIENINDHKKKCQAKKDAETKKNEAAANRKSKNKRSKDKKSK